MRFPTCLAVPLLAAAWLGTAPAAGAGSLAVPVQYTKLENGLKVVLSPDPAAATAVVAVYYNIGFRIEPKDRTGFAHLFEHMMFQGSANLGKMEFIRLVQKNGGILNGSTRFDFTNYFEVVPAHTLETMLWAEADRMRGLAITQDNLTNQQGVVKNEVKVNVLNQPYGGFPWLDLPQYANTNWYNAHNFYGDLEGPGRGDARRRQALLQDLLRAEQRRARRHRRLRRAADAGLDRRSTSGRSRRRASRRSPTSPSRRRREEKRSSKPDPLAPRPALAVGYHVPPRNTPRVLRDGPDRPDPAAGQGQPSLRGARPEGRVHRRGRRRDQLPARQHVRHQRARRSGWCRSSTIATRPPTQILKAFDAEIEALRTTPVDQATLDLAIVKMRSSLYDELESFSGFGLAEPARQLRAVRRRPGARSTGSRTSSRRSRRRCSRRRPRSTCDPRTGRCSPSNRSPKRPRPRASSGRGGRHATTDDALGDLPGPLGRPCARPEGGATGARHAQGLRCCRRLCG